MNYADVVELIQTVKDCILENTIDIDDSSALAAARAAVQVLIDEGLLEVEN